MLNGGQIPKLAARRNLAAPKNGQPRNPKWYTILHTGETRRNETVGHLSTQIPYLKCPVIEEKHTRKPRQHQSYSCFRLLPTYNYGGIILSHRKWKEIITHSHFSDNPK